MTNPTPTSAAAMTDADIDALWNECAKGDDLTSIVRIFANALLAQAAPVAAQEEVVRALVELVACKDASEEVARLLTVPNADHPIVCSMRKQLADEYKDRKPLAWAAARAALRASSAAKEKL